MNPMSDDFGDILVAGLPVRCAVDCVVGAKADWERRTPATSRQPG